MVVQQGRRERRECGVALRYAAARDATEDEAREGARLGGPGVGRV